MTGPASIDDRFRALEAIVYDLLAHVAELERVRGVGDADRVLSLEEVAARIGRSPETIKRHWLRTSASRRAYKLEVLLSRDASGRWSSSPRRIAQWQDAIAARGNRPDGPERRRAVTR